MKILVLNSGSSSIKYKLYDAENADTFTPLAEGQADRIGIDGSNISHKCEGREKHKVTLALPDHNVAIDSIIQLLVDKEHGALESIEELGGVGHRVVHGGEDFTKSVIIDADVEAAIENNFGLAPLHNPANLMGIKAVEAVLPSVKQVAVFDTAIHQTMPKKAFMYALPKEQYTEHKIRRYGFHGTSHGFVAQKAAEELGRPLKDLKVVTCHIGNGGSLAAFSNGESVDTSMGFTPLAGIVMGTRSGDLDPYIPLYIMENQGLTSDEVSTMMNKKGGILGISGKSDMRDVLAAAAAGEQDAIDALDIYVYCIQKYIGAYAAGMNGIDAIVFTAGVGEGSAALRELILENFTFLGLELDKAANDANEVRITTADSKVAAFRICTNEELVIALDAYSLITK